jgi:hypothetical protein
MKERTMGAPPVEAAPPLPWRFFIVAIVVAIAVSAAIAYLGLAGYLGAGITGERSPSGGLVFLPLIGLTLLASVRIRPRRRR